MPLLSIAKKNNEEDDDAEDKDQEPAGSVSEECPFLSKHTRKRESRGKTQATYLD